MFVVCTKCPKNTLVMSRTRVQLGGGSKHLGYMLENNHATFFCQQCKYDNVVLKTVYILLDCA